MKCLRRVETIIPVTLYRKEKSHLIWWLFQLFIKNSKIVYLDLIFAGSLIL